MSELKFPNETADYRAARDRLLEAEIDLRRQVERVAQMRRALPAGGAVKEDYQFEEMTSDGQVQAVKLSELFRGGKTSLFLYSFMYGPEMKNPCPMCSSILDGLNGNARHIEERINLAMVCSPSLLGNRNALCEARRRRSTHGHDVAVVECA
jgi:predicted dithiol-disulfide oxidoreductase (DUF899 family)